MATFCQLVKKVDEVYQLLAEVLIKPLFPPSGILTGTETIPTKALRFLNITC